MTILSNQLHHKLNHGSKLAMKLEEYAKHLESEMDSLERTYSQWELQRLKNYGLRKVKEEETNKEVEARED